MLVTKWCKALCLHDSVIGEDEGAYDERGTQCAQPRDGERAEFVRFGCVMHASRVKSGLKAKIRVFTEQARDKVSHAYTFPGIT